MLESGWFDDCCIDSIEEKRRELAIRVLYVSILRSYMTLSECKDPMPTVDYSYIAINTN
jgi:hypothetical protein